MKQNTNNFANSFENEFETLHFQIEPVNRFSNKMHITYHCNNTPHGNDREHTICGNSTILPIQTVTRPTRRVNQDSKETSRCNGGGTFCCISLVLLFMILLLVQLLVWRFFDIDILPVDDSIANHEMSNSSIHMIANDFN